MEDYVDELLLVEDVVEQETEFYNNEYGDDFSDI